MSYTEIYKITQIGNVIQAGEVRNAWRGAMAVWGIMEKKYCVPLPKPIWMSLSDYNERGYSRCGGGMSSFGGVANPMQDIWDLVNSDSVPELEKIVLASTFDKVIVLKENFDELLKAFNEFEGETNLKEQAEVIEKLNDEKNCIGIAWNQTSVNGGAWQNGSKPYNINKQDKHWNLFEKETI